MRRFDPATIMASAVVAVCTIAVALAACGADTDPTSAPPTDDGAPSLPPTDPGDEGGFGPQAAAPGEFDHEFSTPIAAALEQDDGGCWSLRANGEDFLVVLPEGFEIDPGGQAMVAPDGTVLPAGTEVDATGALFSVDGLPGGVDGRWGNLLTHCRPTATAMVVTDSMVVDDFDPTTLDAGALADLIAEADLAVDWPCGFGFATSTADQRVGLYVDPADFEPPPDGTVTLPNDGWRVIVVVGEHLFVDHCDDVAEWFEPERSVGGTYPLVAGTFEFRAPEPGTDPSDVPVTIVIDGAVVDGPTAPIPLGTITIVNDAYGFFAG